MPHESLAPTGLRFARTARRTLASLVGAAALGACSLEHPALQVRADVTAVEDRGAADDRTVPNDLPSPTDTPTDTPAPPDAGMDVSADLPPDTAQDAGMDIATDVTMDAPIDAPAGDAGDATDAAPDAAEVGCRSNTECDDGDPCTTNLCDLATGRCGTERIAGCCSLASQCDDGNPCTMDACGTSNRCTNTAIAGCCMTSAQCDDGNRCTRDECVSGMCRSSAVAGCCTSPSQCNDMNVCTIDTCNTTTNVCERSAVAGCCTSAMQCDDMNACTTDTCEGSGCVNRAIAGCCASDVQCDDMDACTTDRCAGNTCEHPRVTVAGDNCSNPIALAVTATVQTREGDATACAASDTSGNNDLVYTATLPAGNFVVYADTYGSDFDTRLSLRDGCGGTEILGSNDQCGTPQSQLVTVIPGGRTVSLVVGGAATTDRGRVVLHYLIGAVPAGLTYLRAPPASGATTAARLMGSTGTMNIRGCAAGTNASDTLRASCASNGGGNGPEQLWVSATCPGARAFSASTCGADAWDSIVSVSVPAAPSRLLACNDDSCSSLRSNATGTTPATASPVVILVDGFSDYWSCGGYTLNLSGFYY